MSSAPDCGQNRYCPQAFGDTEDRKGIIQLGDWRHIFGTENINPLNRQSCNRSSHAAVKVGELLKCYLNSAKGSVPLLNDHVTNTGIRN